MTAQSDDWQRGFAAGWREAVEAMPRVQQLDEAKPAVVCSKNDANDPGYIVPALAFLVLGIWVFFMLYGIVRYLLPAAGWLR